MKKLAILLLLVIPLLTSSCQYITGEAPAQTPKPTPPPITSPPPPKTDWEEGSPPPVGIEGWEEPRSLTEAEKASVIEIALNTQRASEWLQGRTDYRAGSVDWYAVIWNSKGEAGTWWSLEYSRVEKEGVPDFVNPYARWYPGVTIAVGESTIYQMQIAVDLDSGETAMAMGPYPSLSSPDRFKIIPEPSPVPAINREQAIETAKRGLPASVIARADISAEVHGWYWEITFDNLKATADELMPYPLKSPPPGPTGQPATDPYPGIWQSVIITVDAQTGNPKSTGARRVPRPGPYVSQGQAIQSARGGVLRFPVDVSWIAGAKVEAYLQGDTWIVLFWEEGSENHRIKTRVDAVTGEFTGGGSG